MQVPCERSITSAPAGTPIFTPIMTPLSTTIAAFSISSPLRTSSRDPHLITVAAGRVKAQKKSRMRKLSVYRWDLDPGAFFPAFNPFFRQLDPFNRFEQPPPERLIFNDVAQEKLP